MFCCVPFHTPRSKFRALIRLSVRWPAGLDFRSPADRFDSCTENCSPQPMAIGAGSTKTRLRRFDSFSGYFQGVGEFGVPARSGNWRCVGSNPTSLTERCISETSVIWLHTCLGSRQWGFKSPVSDCATGWMVSFRVGNRPGTGSRATACHPVVFR